MFRNLVQDLVQHERIETTVAKAKALRPMVEKLITKCRTDSLAIRRKVIKTLGGNGQAVGKLFSDLGPRFAKRQGGYTRILKTGHRHGDNAPLALMEFVERKTETSSKNDKTKPPS